MAEPQSWQEMMAWSAQLLERRTGADVNEWNRRVAESGAEDEENLRAWLGQQGVTGYAQMLLVMERFGYPAYLTASATELIEAQYADRPDLRPVLDSVLAVVAGLGDVQVQARKTYVSLVARRQFAAVKATTRQRVDLGLRLDDAPLEGRLEPARSLANDTINVRIALSSPADIDDEVVAWLQRAYAASS